MKRIFFIGLFILSLIFVNKALAAETKKILDFDAPKLDKILFPFGYFQHIDIEKHIKKHYKGDVDYPIDPWLSATQIISTFKENTRAHSTSRIEWVLQEIDKLMDDFTKNGHSFPHPQYGPYEKGWVSCMDALPVAVSCQLAWEITGNYKYRLFRDTIINTTIKTPSKTSFILHFSDKKRWLSEYTSPNPQKLSSESYVLNGFLVGLHSLKILSTVTGDKQIEDIYNSAQAKYKELVNQYYYKDNEWCYYMLSPLTINPIHYAIFETTLLDALFTLTQDIFFCKEAQKHRKALQNVLKMDFYYTPQGNTEWILFRAGAPHPYMIDTYPLEIRFYDNDKNIINTYSSINDGSYIQRAFIKGELPPQTFYYAVYCQPNQGNYILLYEKKVPIFIKNKSLPHQQNKEYQINFSFDAGTWDLSKNNEARIIWSNRKEARVSLFFKHPLETNLNNYWGIPIYSESNALLSIELRDSQGQAAWRYYPPIKPGNNTVLLHYLGFNNTSNINVKDIKNIMLRFYQAQDSKKDFFIKIDTFHELQNSLQILSFLELFPYINEQN